MSVRRKGSLYLLQAILRLTMAQPPTKEMADARDLIIYWH